MRRRSPLWARLFFRLLLLGAAFAAGVLAERAGWLPGAARRPPPGLGHTFDPFWETWHLVDEHYVDREAVQPQRMTRGAIEGLLDSLGDVGHTSYLTPEQVKQLESGLEGQFEGIGATLTIHQRRPTVMTTLPNSPARAAGLRPGDVLLEVDGKDVSDTPLDLVVNQVRGPAGTAVRLRVLREGESQPLDFRITRGQVDVPSVTWRLLPGEPVAHVAVRDFSTHAHDQLKIALKEAQARGARGLVLDLRGNQGGLKDQAVAVTSEFLKDGNVFLEQDARGNRTPVPVRPGGDAADVPLVALIDRGTASSAEILAGALQDHGRAKLVGTRTFGTGTVLKPFPLSDDSAVLLAVTEWLTPDGRQIWHKGIAPDVEVALPRGATVLLPELEADLDAAALARSSDAQLLRALEEVKKQIR